MATIREKRPGYWEVREFVGRDEQGRPIQVSRVLRGTKRDALRVAAELVVAPSSAAAARTTVGELLELWREHSLASWAPSTASTQESRICRIRTDPIAQVVVSRLRALDVDQWHVRLARQGVGESSIRNQHQALRAALGLAVRWGWVPANVAAAARLRRRASVPRSALTADDVRRVLASVADLVASGKVEPHASLALRLAAITGARRSELAAIRWDDLEGRRLTIDSSIAVIRHASDEVPTLLRDDPTKTGCRRVVAMDEATLSLVADLRRRTESPGPWILGIGSDPVMPDRISAWWRRARNLAGVETKFRLHDLRHWSATTSIAAGHDVRTVANRLGHANPAMTLRVYAHAVEAADIPVAQTLADALDFDPTARSSR